MKLCIFNPEHDLCLASGRAHYLPPQSARIFAQRDAAVMQVLYPDAHCCSAYDLPSSSRLQQCDSIHAWGWNATLKHQLLRAGLPEHLLPSDTELATIRTLQHRTTVLPLQPDCRPVYSVAEAECLFSERTHWVLKAPWSGAGRGLRWLHGSLSEIDRRWIVKTVAAQRCVIAEPNRQQFGDRSGANQIFVGEAHSSVADVALEYMGGRFVGYSYFKTGGGVYKENVMWSDDYIASTFPLANTKARIEQWLDESVWPLYQGPLGVDLMVCADGHVYVSEINLRHTMGMVAHQRMNKLDDR